MTKKVLGFSVERTKRVLTDVFKDALNEVYDKTLQNGSEGHDYANATCRRYTASETEKMQFSPLYGEVRVIAIQRLFEASEKVDIFVDIGSGISKTALAAALMYPECSGLKEIIGIEGRIEMVTASNKVIDQFVDAKYAKPIPWTIKSAANDHRILTSGPQTMTIQQGIFNNEVENRSVCEMIAEKTKDKKTLVLFNVNLDSKQMLSAAQAFNRALPKDNKLLGIITYNASMAADRLNERQDWPEFLRIMESQGFIWAGDVWINTSWGCADPTYDKGTFFGHFIRKNCKVNFSHPCQVDVP